MSHCFRLRPHTLPTYIEPPSTGSGTAGRPTVDVGRIPADTWKFREILVLIYKYHGSNRLYHDYRCYSKMSSMSAEQFGGKHTHPSQLLLETPGCFEYGAVLQPKSMFFRPSSEALTFKMPLASISKVTSICGTPRGAGGMPSSAKHASPKTSGSSWCIEEDHGPRRP